MCVCVPSIVAFVRVKTKKNKKNTHTHSNTLLLTNDIPRERSTEQSYPYQICRGAKTNPSIRVRAAFQIEFLIFFFFLFCRMGNSRTTNANIWQQRFYFLIFLNYLIRFSILFFLIFFVFRLNECSA
jgi:hypothetical protein